MQRAATPLVRKVLTPSLPFLHRQPQSRITGFARPKMVQPQQKFSTANPSPVLPNSVKVKHGVEFGQLIIPEPTLVTTDDATQNAEKLLAHTQKKIAKLPQPAKQEELFKITAELIANLNNGARYNFQSPDRETAIYKLFDLFDQPIPYTDKTGQPQIGHPRILCWHNDSPIHLHPAGGNLQPGDISCIPVAATPDQINVMFDLQKQSVNADLVKPGGYMIDNSVGKHLEGKKVVHQWILPQQPLKHVSVNEESVYGVTVNWYIAEPSTPAPGEVVKIDEKVMKKAEALIKILRHKNDFN